MELETLTQEITLKDKAYVALPDFLDMCQKSFPFPYKSSFSFNKYVSSLQNSLAEACSHTQSALLPVIQFNQELIEKGTLSIDELMEMKEFQTILTLAIPSLIYENEMSFLSVPFHKSFGFMTAPFRNLFSDKNWEMEIDLSRIDHMNHIMRRQVGSLILNKFYNQDIDLASFETFKILNKESKLEKYFRIEKKFDFVEIIANGELPEISDATIKSLISNSDPTLWESTFPSDKFSFEGFVVGRLTEITETSIILDLKNLFNSRSDDSLPIKEFIDRVSSLVSSYLGRKDIRAGMMVPALKNNFEDYQNSVTGVESLEHLLAKSPEDQGIYDHMINLQKTVFIEDLTSLENPSSTEQSLLFKGFKSIVLYPVFNETGSINSVLELASKEVDTFNGFITDKLTSIFEIIDSATHRFLEDFENRTDALIQKNFTSIHPSVQWKFEEVALDYYTQMQNNTENPMLSPIVFKDIYPLYGQADIVSSSTIRNQSIQADLLDNLHRAKNLIEIWLQQKEMHLLEAYKLKIERLISKIEEHFVSTDESEIVHFFVDKLHPELKKIKERYHFLNTIAYHEYFNIIDVKLGIIYNKRRDFEESVAHLNAAISSYLDQEEEHMQVTLNHYFEKYKTDGVEYNLYLGQSLLENGTFYDSDLKNFKIWQLKTMAEITQLVNDLQPKLSVPLTTAQLIFVYNNSLSIRFRMDEKKFDVDGAYNVRYEILKKRIDKAVVKGTGERLTQAGKIAIVYLTEQDKAEYLDFCEYLIGKNLISEQIEDLELDRLQGAEGLKALRLTVM